jgi:hypothetical protein
MALKVRAARVSIGDGGGDDPQVIVNAEVFDDATNRVIASQVLHFSLVGMDQLTNAQKTALVRDAAVAWASQVKANAGKAETLLGLVGASVVIP